jgi:8-oxo-dGTP pyrophosphatase MutT (NUDIX family)
MTEKVVFQTPWFQLIAKQPPGWQAPHYSIRTHDYVCVVAVSRTAGLVLVRQYRPAISAYCLDLPSGHVDPGEPPEEAARRELLEETGYRAGKMHLLGRLAPDVGRLGNSMWCFYTADILPSGSEGGEPGVQTVLYHRSLGQLLREPEFNHALHHAALLLALSQERICMGEDFRKRERP